jgi:hypothetical protein
VLSRQENRCVLTYLWYTNHSKDLILIFGVLETVLRNLIDYQMIRLIWVASQVPAKRVELHYTVYLIRINKLILRSKI